MPAEGLGSLASATENNGIEEGQPGPNVVAMDDVLHIRGIEGRLREARIVHLQDPLAMHGLHCIRHGTCGHLRLQQAQQPRRSNVDVQGNNVPDRTPELGALSRLGA